MTVNGARPDANGDVAVDLPGLDGLEGEIALLGDAVSAENRRAAAAEAALSGRIADEAQERTLLAAAVRDNAADIAEHAEAIAGLAAKAPGPVAGNLAALDAQGNPVDSGRKPSDFQPRLAFDAAPTAGSQNPVTSDGVKRAIDAAAPDGYAGVKAQVQANTDAITDVRRDLGNMGAGLAGKADRPAAFAAGNLAALDAQGNPVDSGRKPSDFQPRLAFDAAPTAGSQNPVTSDGVKRAIDAAAPDGYAGVKAQVQANTGAITDAQRDIAGVKAVIPAQAAAQNQLADKAFVNSSIATNTAFYISDGGGPFRSLADLENYEGALTNNDYAFVAGRDAAGNTTYTRYKWNEAAETWAEEYVLNNSSFTAAQWEAISSGITSGLVAKLGALPAAEALAAALAGKQARLVVQSGYAWRFSTESQGAGIEAFMEDAGGYSVTSETAGTGMRYSVAGYDTGLYFVPDTLVTRSTPSVQFLVYNASETELYGTVSASYEAVSEGIPPEVDPEPANGSGRLTTSGGIWSMVWGALAALPAGFSSLYGWAAAQLAGKVPVSRTVNGKALTADVTLTAADIDFRVSGGGVSVQLALEDMDAGLAGKADRPAAFAAGDFAEFDAQGNPVDSGRKPSDYLRSDAASITSPGVVTDWLASGATGGVRVRASSSNLSNYTAYAYGGVAVRRNNATDDFLWQNDAGNNGIARHKDIFWAKNPSSPSNRSVRYFAVTGAATLGVMPGAAGGKAREFVVEVENKASAAAEIEFYELGAAWNAVVDAGQDLSAMTSLAPGEMARFRFEETAFEKDGLPVFHVAKQVVRYPGAAQTVWSLNADGTASTEGELDPGGTFTFEADDAAVRPDGTVVLDAF